MGLLSTYVAYRLGKRSERRENARQACEAQAPTNSQCIHYDYCSARGACLELTECEYE
jgi:hypothetical protein